MYRFRKYGAVATTVAIMAATSSVVLADDSPGVEDLREQISQFQKQLKVLKDSQAKTAETVAQIAPEPGAAKIPKTGGQMGSPVGGFYIPGTKTAMKIGFMTKLDMAYDMNAGMGKAGFDNYSIRPAELDSGQGGFALPGTPAARRKGILSFTSGFARINMDTRTPIKYGELKVALEIDFAGSTGGNAYGGNAHTPRLRQAYLTLGGWTLGQTWTTFFDGPSGPSSIHNNGPVGKEGGLRIPQVRYTFNFDSAQKHQMNVAIENPFNDFYKGDIPAHAGGPQDTKFSSTNIPEFVARYAYNDSWGRFFLAGIARKISINTSGLDFNVVNHKGPASDRVFGGGLNTGFKIYLTDKKNDAIMLRFVGGKGIGRYMNVSGINSNPSAVLDEKGKLKLVDTNAYLFSYQRFWTDDHVWQSNIILGKQNTKFKNGLIGSGVGIPKTWEEIEFNLFWAPNSYISMGPAFVHATGKVISPYTNMKNGKASGKKDSDGKDILTGMIPGATRDTSSRKVKNNRIQFSITAGF
ncbi:MAG: porin [Rhodospirillaceae bacterium]|jgi:hypothetical protein|nr:porin [Rhodospirillaceae bacterium]